MKNFYLILFIGYMFPSSSESKCLDKCQYIPSFEWREQCNTCLEIPCRRCGAFFCSSFADVVFLSLSLFCFWMTIPYPSVYFFCLSRWCSFTAYIYEGIERGCSLYCGGYVNPRGYEQKQFVRYGSGFVPIRYDVNPGYLATHG